MKCIVQVLGPTGVGKSRVALALAERFNGEIISADAIQVYRGFDIGSDKIEPHVRQSVPHHLIDIIDDCAQFNAFQFLQLSFTAAEAISGRGRLPVVCGGTAFYLRTQLRGIFPEKEHDRRLRLELKQRAEKEGSEPLWLQLQQIDPDYAAAIGRNDLLRIVRALEIYAHTGLPPSAMFKQNRTPFGAYRFVRIGLRLERAELYRRIDRRVTCMLEQGLVEEVRSLLARHPPSCPPFQAVGYREILQHLRGEIGLDAAVELIQRRTRHFAKRQISWFRSEKDIVWFSPDALDAIVRHMETRLWNER